MLKKLVLVTVMLIMLFAGVPSIQAIQNLTLGHIGVSVSSHQMGVTIFIAEIDRLLPGHFKIENKGGSTLGSETDIWEALKLGTIDLAFFTAISVSSFVPQIGVVSLPFLFRDSDHAAKVLDGPIGQKLGDLINSPEMIFLGYSEHGFRHMTNSKRPILQPSDIAGLRIRVMPNPIMEATFKAFGAQVVPLPWPTVYGALDDGRIDGQENPLMTISGSRLHYVQHFLSMTGHTYSVLMILINANTYKAMKPEEQNAFKAAARITAVESRKAVLAKDQSILVEIQQQGVKITEKINPDPFIKTLEPLWPEWENRFGADLIKQISETK